MGGDEVVNFGAEKITEQENVLFFTDGYLGEFLTVIFRLFIKFCHCLDLLTGLHSYDFIPNWTPLCLLLLQLACTCLAICSSIARHTVTTIISNKIKTRASILARVSFTLIYI